MLTKSFGLSVMCSSRLFAASTEKSYTKTQDFYNCTYQKLLTLQCDWKRIRAVLIASHNGEAYMNNHKGRKAESMIRVILVRLHFRSVDADTDDRNVMQIEPLVNKNHRLPSATLLLAYSGFELGNQNLK